MKVVVSLSTINFLVLTEHIGDVLSALRQAHVALIRFEYSRGFHIAVTRQQQSDTALVKFQSPLKI